MNVRGAMNCATTNAFFLNVKCIVNFRFYYKRWINKQIDGTSVTCVLIGCHTADSKWVKYEIVQSIEKGNGLLGMYIHSVKDRHRQTSTKGKSRLRQPPINFTPTDKPNLVYPCCSFYDWVIDNGYHNLGNWIEKAAHQAGRYYTKLTRSLFF